MPRLSRGIVPVGTIENLKIGLWHNSEIRWHNRAFFGHYEGGKARVKIPVFDSLANAYIHAETEIYKISIPP